MNDEQIAMRIVSDAQYNEEIYDDMFPEKLYAAIVQALRDARKAPRGSIIDEQGVVRRVLGDLAITADGFIACQNSVVWHPTDGGCYPVPDGLNMAAKVYGGARLVDVGECYSSLEASQKAKAAETAKEAKEAK